MFVEEQSRMQRRDFPAALGLSGTRTEPPISEYPWTASRNRAHRARLELLGSTEEPHTHGEESSAGDLVRAAARGEMLAWSRLVRRFGGLVRGVARSYGLNDADVADVSQVVWLRLVDHLGRLRDPNRVAGWLATTTRNESLRTFRQRDRTRPTSDIDILNRLQDTSEPDAALARQERTEVLRELIQTLAHNERRLLEMFTMDPQPSYKEISEALGIPVGSIGPTRQRCLARLRALCISAGIDSAC